MKKVSYIGTQFAVGVTEGGDNPEGLLVVGHTYQVFSETTWRWHTLYRLFEWPGKVFNSLCFSDVAGDVTDGSVPRPVGAIKHQHSDVDCFEHFMSYTGGWREDQRTQDKLRQAYLDGYEAGLNFEQKGEAT